MLSTPRHPLARPRTSEARRDFSWAWAASKHRSSSALMCIRSKAVYDATALDRSSPRRILAWPRASKVRHGFSWALAARIKHTSSALMFALGWLQSWTPHCVRLSTPRLPLARPHASKARRDSLRGWKASKHRSGNALVCIRSIPTLTPLRLTEAHQAARRVTIFVGFGSTEIAPRQCPDVSIRLIAIVDTTLR